MILFLFNLFNILIIIFSFLDDTVWLTQEQIALLFNVDRTRIVRHINNIYSDNELDMLSTCVENAQVQFEGARQVKRKIKIYNLDMITSLSVSFIFKVPFIVPFIVPLVTFFR